MKIITMKLSFVEYFVLFVVAIKARRSTTFLSAKLYRRNFRGKVKVSRVDESQVKNLKLSREAYFFAIVPEQESLLVKFEDRKAQFLDSKSSVENYETQFSSSVQYKDSYEDSNSRL